MSIFKFDDVDTTKAPAAKRNYNDHVARVAFAESTDGGNGVRKLDGWRFATGDQAVAEALGLLFGASPVETETTKEEFIVVYTDKTAVDVVLTPDAISADYKLWINKQLMHHCDGFKFLSGDNTGESCHCPTTLEEKKARAKIFQGPKPSIEVKFRLAEDYDLGVMKVSTGSWGFAKDMWLVERALSEGGEQLFRLEMDSYSFTPSSGPNKNKPQSVTQPKLAHVKSWNAAIADDPEA